jgi:hypothetical protein
MQIPSFNWTGNNSWIVNYTPIWVAHAYSVWERVSKGSSHDCSSTLHVMNVTIHAPQLSFALSGWPPAQQTTPLTLIHLGLLLGGLYIRMGKYASCFIRVSTNRQYIRIESW